MQIEKNQGKIKFCFIGANFRKNLNLAVSLHIIQFYNTPLESIFADAVFFFFHFFLSFPVFFFFFFLF